MAVSNGTSDEPDERTALLNGNTSKPDDSATSDTIKAIGNWNADGEASKSGVDDGDDDADEACEVTEENPLFEGNLEMRKKLYILCPAVAIGVSYLISHIFNVLSKGWTRH